MPISPMLPSVPRVATPAASAVPQGPVPLPVVAGAPSPQPVVDEPTTTGTALPSAVAPDLEPLPASVSIARSAPDLLTTPDAPPSTEVTVKVVVPMWANLTARTEPQPEVSPEPVAGGGIPGAPTTGPIPVGDEAPVSAPPAVPVANPAVPVAVGEPALPVTLPTPTVTPAAGPEEPGPAATTTPPAATTSPPVPDEVPVAGGTPPVALPPASSAPEEPGAGATTPPPVTRAPDPEVPNAAANMPPLVADDVPVAASTPPVAPTPPVDVETTAATTPVTTPAPTPTPASPPPHAAPQPDDAPAPPAASTPVESFPEPASPQGGALSLRDKVGMAQQRSLQNQQLVGAVTAMLGARLTTIGSNFAAQLGALRGEQPTPPQ